MGASKAGNRRNQGNQICFTPIIYKGSQWNHTSLSALKGNYSIGYHIIHPSEEKETHFLSLLGHERCVKRKIKKGHERNWKQ
jgi:hypothetical protein